MSYGGVPISKEFWWRLETKNQCTYQKLLIGNKMYYRHEVFGRAEEKPEVIIDHDDNDGFTANERRLATRIQDLEAMLFTATKSGGINMMTPATIAHEQDVAEKSSIHKAIGFSNKVVLCGLTGNIVMGPVAAYLTDNLSMLIIIEAFATIIFICGLLRRPEAKEILNATKKEIRSRHLLADAVIKDANKTISDSKEVSIRGVA